MKVFEGSFNAKTSDSDVWLFVICATQHTEFSKLFCRPICKLRDWHILCSRLCPPASPLAVGQGGFIGSKVLHHIVRLLYAPTAATSPASAPASASLSMHPAVAANSTILICGCILLISIVHPATRLCVHLSTTLLCSYSLGFSTSKRNRLGHSRSRLQAWQHYVLTLTILVHLEESAGAAIREKIAVFRNHTVYPTFSTHVGQLSICLKRCYNKFDGELPQGCHQARNHLRADPDGSLTLARKQTLINILPTALTIEELQSLVSGIFACFLSHALLLCLCRESCSIKNYDRFDVVEVENLAHPEKIVNKLVGVFAQHELLGTSKCAFVHPAHGINPYRLATQLFDV
mmetsp:Transcript_98586/g.195584  ORF Transcript_98586/g.195584 Transcript_98586/m.195584 type:complete len:347 (-) Transcript_98586:64-1104(-)